MNSMLPIILFFGVIAVLYWIRYNSEEQKLKRRLAQAKPVKVQEAREGAIVKLVGKVRVEQTPLEAPFSAQKCVYYLSTVHEQSKTGSDAWEVILRETNTIDFWLEDDSGRALIRAEKLKVSAFKDNEFASGLFKDAPERLEQFLARHGQKSTGWVLNRGLQYREGLFAVGESVAVLGKVHWEHDPDPKNAGKGFRDAPKRLVLEPLPDGYIFASDESSTLG